MGNSKVTRNLKCYCVRLQKLPFLSTTAPSWINQNVSWLSLISATFSISLSLVYARWSHFPLKFTSTINIQIKDAVTHRSLLGCDYSGGRGRRDLWCCRETFHISAASVNDGLSVTVAIYFLHYPRLPLLKSLFLSHSLSRFLSLQSKSATFIACRLCLIIS